MNTAREEFYRRALNVREKSEANKDYYFLVL